MILTLRTDNPQAEIGLYDGDVQLAYLTWHAHRKLAETLHQTIDQLLRENDCSLADLTCLIVYKGPGSFTGLRIGISVMNALSASYDIPIVAASGDNWISKGLAALRDGVVLTVALPEYGSAPHITVPKK